VESGDYSISADGRVGPNWFVVLTSPWRDRVYGWLLRSPPRASAQRD